MTKDYKKKDYPNLITIQATYMATQLKTLLMILI
jgi:hypothetical protein